MSEVRVGITENGDASVDYSWEKKLDTVDMAILITKNITDEFIHKAIQHRNKVIVHATCTGFGGTVLEPNVPKCSEQLEQTKKMIAAGFPAEQVVVRIDPIIPTDKGVEMFEKIVDAMHRYVKRYRISVIDNYPHVKERFKKAGLPELFNGEFTAPESDFAKVDLAISRLKFRFPDIVIESCAEPNLRKTKKIGCVSAEDMKKFGLKPEKNTKKKRVGCLCEPKKELLPYNHCWWCTKKNEETNSKGSCEEGDCKQCPYLQVYGCPHRCLYCYWKT